MIVLVNICESWNFWFIAFTLNEASWRGMNQMCLFVGPQSVRRGSISMISTSFERCSGEACNKHTCAFGGDVRIHCKEGRLKEALHILDLMDQEGIRVCLDTYVFLLQGCIIRNALAEGKWVHTHIIKSGFEQNIVLGNALVNMYSKCGSVAEARLVFDKMPKRDVVSWTAMIGGYARLGHGEDALKLFSQMQGETVKPGRVTFISVLRACAHLSSLEQGKKIHAHIIKSGFESDIFVGTALIDMYVKSGSLKHARQVFDKMQEWSVVSWNVIISACARHGRGEQAFKLFQEMWQEGLK
eukprot:c25216_g4_i1 orf=220-1116(+)